MNEITFSNHDIDVVYQTAERLTEEGFEVSAPKSYDNGETYFITVS